MEVPANFSEAPGEDLHHYFRNLCIHFKKMLETSKDVALLEQEMQRFINVSKQMNWHDQSSGVYRKDEGVKAAEKVWTEFKRYKTFLQSNLSAADPKDLIAALNEVERLIRQSKVT